MSSVALSGNAGGSGAFVIASPNSNSSRTLTLPDGTGTFTVNGVNSNIVSGTAVASTSGTSIDFTGIPAWVKRITVMFNGVSLSSTSQYLIQIGSGSVTTSGYLSYCTYQGAANVVGNYTSTAGFISAQAGAVNLVYGSATILNITSNTWVSNHVMGLNGNGAGYSISGGGNVTLSATLDRVRITTTNGTDTFDAGSINILYE